MTLEYLNLHVVKPTKTADTNLITNPSFELNTTGWTAMAGAATADTTESRWGYQSLAVTCTTAVNDGVYYGTVAATAGDSLTFSVDIKGVDGIPYKISFADTSANLVGTATEFTGTGYWDRQVCTYSATDTESLRIYITKNNNESVAPFYIDGAMCELRDEESTYIDGDREDCYWTGQAHASTSVRLATTRRGGTLVDLSDYMHISSFMGLGMNPYTLTKQVKADGRSLFQRTLKRDRELILTGELIGSNYDDLQADRAAILDLFKPDYVTGDQDVTIRYQGTTSAGLPASETVYLRVRMRSDGMLGNWNKPTQENLALIFEAYDDLYADGEGAAVLDYNDTLADADYIVYQDSDGVWHSMAGVTGLVSAIAQHPITKDIYIGGTFTNAGGDADADNLARWNGSAWVSVIAGLTGGVYELLFDAAGNLYIGGGFVNIGDANGDGIIKWDGSSVSSLGTGITLGGGAVYAIAFDSSGNLYVGGTFSAAGGVANTVNIAKWDGSTWTALSTGLSGTVRGIRIDKSDNIYIVGSFTNAGDANGDYVVKWTGTAWESLGTGANAVIYTAALDNADNLYVGGQFSSIGGVTVSYLAMWNGKKWEELGGTTNGFVYKLNYVDNKLYLTGDFTSVGSVDLVDRAAIYLGNGIFSPLDINLPGAAVVYDLLFDNRQNLYVGFSTSGDAEVAGDTDVTVTGTATHPKFTITGAGLLRQIVNYTNGDALYFNNFTLLSNEVVTLDFDRGIFESNFRGNILTYILEGISTLNFKLDPGTNRIATFIDGTTDSNTNAVMTWKTRYWSIDEAKR